MEIHSSDKVIVIIQVINNFQCYPPTLIAYKKCVALQIYLTQIHENLVLKKRKFFLTKMLRLYKSLGKINFL